jgi:hypothetical protein
LNFDGFPTIPSGGGVHEHSCARFCFFGTTCEARADPRGLRCADLRQWKRSRERSGFSTFGKYER